MLSKFSNAIQLFAILVCLILFIGPLPAEFVELTRGRALPSQRFKHVLEPINRPILVPATGQNWRNNAHYQFPPTKNGGRIHAAKSPKFPRSCEVGTWHAHSTLVGYKLAFLLAIRLLKTHAYRRLN